MSMKKPKFILSSLSIGVATLLIGCGGGGSTGSAAAPDVVYLSGFTSNVLTSGNAKMGRYSGGPADGWNCTNSGPTYCEGVKDTATRYYAYYAYPIAQQVDNGTASLYSGIFFQAPGVSADDIAAPATLSGVSAANKTKLNFKLGMNSEWYSATEKSFGVMLTMSTRYVVSGNNCRIKLWQVVTPTSADDKNYSINMSDFRIHENCSTTLTLSQILADQTVVQLDFQANAGAARIAASAGQAREAANTTVVNQNGDGFTATTMSVVAPITFN